MACSSVDFGKGHDAGEGNAPPVSRDLRSLPGRTGETVKDDATTLKAMFQQQPNHIVERLAAMDYQRVGSSSRLR